MPKKSLYSLFHRLCASALIILHLVTFGPVREALAFSTSSDNYNLNSGTMNAGGNNRGNSYTKLLLHADGSDGSVSFIDEAKHSILVNGNAQIDTAQSKFGSASAFFDGRGDYLSLPDSGDWDFGTGDFTIDLWVRFNTVAFAQFLSRNDYYDYSLSWGSNKLYWSQAWSDVVTRDWTPVKDTWYHLAIVRASSKLKMFVNGVQLGADVANTDNLTYADAICIGGPSYFFDGYIDELRISKGIARWTSDFTPPQGPCEIDYVSNAARLWQDAIGESCIGNTHSTNFFLDSGLLPTIQSNQPILTQNIPYQSWNINTTKDSAFDLDDYFLSPDGLALTYSAYSLIGNSQIKVTIDPRTHSVSFSQPQGYSGIERIRFIATDSEGSSLQSNEVALQVTAPAGEPNKPLIVSAQLTPVIIKEGDLITLTVRALDVDNQELSFSYSSLFSETNRYKDGDYWVSQAVWQAPANSGGHQTVMVTASDGSLTDSLTDSVNVLVNIGNLNHPPVFTSLPDVVVNEGKWAVITRSATDSDNDPVIFYYSAPFDTQGKWLTNYDDAGTYNIQVTASDGIDTVSKTAKIIVNNTNRPPQPTLTLSKYTVRPNEEFTITLSATDPDGDMMSFVIEKEKDGVRVQIASGTLSHTPYHLSQSFSTIGGYNITATVTDSGGFSSSDSKGVDCADPNANREVINPVMGDFNGDALTDLGLHNSENGSWEICLSDKGVFRSAADWLSGFGASQDKAWWPIGGDFNGDALTDIGVYNNTTGELKLAFSNGGNPKTSAGSFSNADTQLTFPEASYSWQPLTGNFNADKYTDFALYNKETGEVRVALGAGCMVQGAGFKEFSVWLNNSDKDYTALGGDFNGDSLTDLCLFKKSSGEFKVISSNSSGFVDGLVWLSGFSAEKDPIVSDFNNDGLADVGYWDKDTGRWYYAISTGAGFVNNGLWLDNFGSSNEESATTGDFNGDGITDAACFDRDALGINRWNTRLSTNKPADLLTQIDNGIGGKTQITYTYAAQENNPGLPFPVYVASQISLLNTYPADRAASYTQNFSFSGGYFDTIDREFRGFAEVKVTDTITGNYSQTCFYQGKREDPDPLARDGALKGQIKQIISYDGNGNEISQTFNTYEVRKAGSAERFLGAPLLTETTTTVYEENRSFITTKNQFTYDNIGNPLTEKNQGDANKTGDEKSTAFAYAQAYEAGFNRPLETQLKDKDANTVSRKTFEYDSKGNLIVERIAYSVERIGADSEMISTRYSYDSFGNLTSSANAKGATTSTEYETDYYTYPKKVTNAIGHTLTYIYDPKFGVVTEAIDPNGTTSTTEYDSLARITRALVNSQTKVTYEYPDFNTKITFNAIGLSSSEHIDGLGRKYKTVSSGEDGAASRLVSKEAYFNNRGIIDRESLPHYIDEAPNAYTKYLYDIRGRLKFTVADFGPTFLTASPIVDDNYVVPLDTKDASVNIKYIDPLYSETTDAEGHRKGGRKDVYGNIIEVTEFIAGELGDNPSTTYKYDIQNNLIETKDRKKNTTRVFYDSLGRKVKMIDPDMGIWAYEYDSIGNLTKQTDAKAQVLTFEYDQLNRLTAKWGLSPQGTVPILLARYLYDDETKPNCIGRLSKVTDQSGSTEFFYDELGREIKSIKSVSSLRGATPSEARGSDEAISYTIEREYDSLDRLTKLTYPDGQAVAYTYDSNSGLLESVFPFTLDPSPLTYFVKHISYNAKGQIKTIQYGNNTTTDYTYGQDLRLSHILTSSLTSTLQNLTYTFDHNGNVETITDNLLPDHKTRRYRYDGLDRLTEARDAPAPGGGYGNFYYKYDSIGNLLEKTEPEKPTLFMQYGQNAGPHALTSAGGYNYTYDANGNMTVGKNKSFAYDAENRLLSVNESGVVTSFIYDGDGGRVKKRIADSVERIEKETTYIGSLYEVERSADSVERIVKHIFAGSNRVCSITTPASSPSPQRGEGEGEGAASVSYYHSDHLGSSNIITDATGNLVEHYEYTPYGTAIPLPSGKGQGDGVTKHLFTGKELDSTGLYFYGARYYDPEIGRFITADTIIQAPYDPQSLNRYSYCRNNPVNYVDPSGNFWFIPVIIAIAKGALIGAAIGAASAAIMGGDIGRGALFGAISGAIFTGVNQLAQVAMKFAITGTTQVSLIGGARAAANITSSFLGGATSGAAIAGMSGGDVGKSALVGGAIAGGISLMSETAIYMRNKMIKQSRLDPRNSSGKSAGFKGDEFKLGGGRYDSVHPNGNPSPLGGKQGDVGQIFGMRYKPGDIWDRIVETYAGPHDYLNSWGYDMFGNLKNQTTFEGFLGATLNPLNVVVATPLAVSSVVPQEAYAAPAIIFGLSKENETK